MAEVTARTTLGNAQIASGTADQRSRRPVPLTLVAAFAASVLIVAVVYEPWVKTPFDILDFSDFLAILQQSDSYAQRLADFTRYYATQGRFNILNYAFLAWKWSLFGWNEAAWQIARSAQMLCIVIGVYLLLRRLDAERSGSVAGAALFIVAQTASPAWIRLPMGEPLGLMAALGASLIATRYQGTAQWRAAGAAIAALLSATILTKELLIVLVPFVLLLACARRPSGEVERPRLTRRNAWVVSLTAAGQLAVGIPVTIIALNASQAAYSADYGRGTFTAGHFLYSFLSVMLPVQGLFGRDSSLSLQAGNLVFLGVLAAGWMLVVEDETMRRRWVSVGVGAKLLAVAAALIYLPIPYFQDYFGLPFVVAPAILLAIAVSAIERRRPMWRWVAYAACAIVLCQGALDAARASRASIAARKIHRALVSDFAAHSSVDSVVVMMSYVFTDKWRRRGPTLGRYAKAVLTGQRFPAIFDDAPCSAIPLTASSAIGNVMLVSYWSQCGNFKEPQRMLREDYTYIGWPNLAPVRDSIVISIVGPNREAVR